MATEKNTSSVIAKLMGLNEMPPQQQPIYRPQRVLSESYLRKSASICSSEKRSSKHRQISRMESKKKAKLAINDLSNDVSLRYREQICYSLNGIEGVNSTIDLESQHNSENDKLVKGIVKRNDLFNFSNLHSDLKDRLDFSPTNIAVLKPNLLNVKKQLLERLKMTKVSLGIQPLGKVASVLNLKSNRRSEWENPIDIITKECLNDDSLTKVPIFRNFDFSSNRTTKFKKMSKSDVKSSFGKQKHNSSANLEKIPLVSSSDTKLETEDVDLFSGDVISKQKSEQIACNYSVKEGCSSHFSNVSFGQESPSRFDENEFISSNCIEIDDGVPKNIGEAYQPSPDSVLKPPFKEGNSPSSEYCESVSTDLHCLWLQLQLLKSETEENHSGHEMVVSSDGDSTEKSSYITAQNLNPVRRFGAKESRDFSYLVDVLEESGFHGGNVEMSFERWHSPESMASPSVFETLEKKYGKQDLWNYADRKLLFDRINSGVTEILRSLVDIPICSNPLRRKMSAILRKDVIEEELWKLLLCQERKVNNEFSEKALGTELEFVDEVDSISREIEIFLFDELVAEFVND